MNDAGELALREIAAARFAPEEIQALLAAPGHLEDFNSLGLADEDELRVGLAQSGLSHRLTNTERHLPLQP